MTKWEDTVKFCNEQTKTEMRLVAKDNDDE